MTIGSNWANNHVYNAARLHRPETIEELQEIVARSPKAKALGTRHSFNDIADTTGDLISLERFDRIVALDRGNRTVTVEGGVRYGALCPYLDSEGYALHNLASLPHISVAGACATATHGSGVGNGSLATAVTAIEFVAASGERVTLSRERNGDLFPGAVVGLGALGPVTKVTLALEPTFRMRQDIYENLPFPQLEAHFEEIVSSGYSVSLFTDWSGPRIEQVWRKRRIPEEIAADAMAEPVWFGATAATRDRHPLPDHSAENCTPQMGVPGPWYERLPHFRMEFTPSSGEELQSELFVPRSQALAAFAVVRGMSDSISPLLHISEVRTIAADDHWMSPCYRRDCVAIHFTWKKDWPAVRQVLPRIEERLAPLGARPHWGKLFTQDDLSLRSSYERLPDFAQLVRRYDPEGKFQNAFLSLMA